MTYRSCSDRRWGIVVWTVVALVVPLAACDAGEEEPAAEATEPQAVEDDPRPEPEPEQETETATPEPTPAALPTPTPTPSPEMPAHDGEPDLGFDVAELEARWEAAREGFGEALRIADIEVRSNDTPAFVAQLEPTNADAGMEGELAAGDGNVRRIVVSVSTAVEPMAVIEATVGWVTLIGAVDPELSSDQRTLVIAESGIFADDRGALTDPHEATVERDDVAYTFVSDGERLHLTAVPSDL